MGYGPTYENSDVRALIFGHGNVAGIALASGDAGGYDYGSILSYEDLISEIAAVIDLSDYDDEKTPKLLHKELNKYSEKYSRNTNGSGTGTMAMNNAL